MNTDEKIDTDEDTLDDSALDQVSGGHAHTEAKHEEAVKDVMHKEIFRA